MSSKNWWFVAAACLLIIAVYQVAKFAGDDSAESRSREKEPALQEEKDDYLAADLKEQAAEEEDNELAANLKEQAVEKRDNDLAASLKEQAAEKRDNDLAAKLKEQAVEKRDNDLAASPKEKAAEKKDNGTAASPKEQAVEKDDDDVAVKPTEGSPVSPPAAKAPRRGLITGIVYSVDSRSAVIDNRVFHEGDTLGGVTVVKIQKDRVTFEKEGKQAILRWTQRISEAPKAYWE